MNPVLYLKNYLIFCCSLSCLSYALFLTISLSFRLSLFLFMSLSLSPFLLPSSLSPTRTCKTQTLLPSRSIFYTHKHTILFSPSTARSHLSPLNHPSVRYNPIHNTHQRYNPNHNQLHNNLIQVEISP